MSKAAPPPPTAQQSMTRRPSAGRTRHEQITVFIYIIIASRRTPLFYYCQRQGHRAMIHGRAAEHPLHAVRSQRVEACTRRHIHDSYVYVPVHAAAGGCRSCGCAEPGINYSLLPLARRCFFSWPDERSSPLCVCGGGACAKNVTFASSHQKKHTQKNTKAGFYPLKNILESYVRNTLRDALFFSAAYLLLRQSDEIWPVLWNKS